MKPHIPLIEVKEVGLIKEVKQGIVKAKGLGCCIYGQLVSFNNGSLGMVIGFDENDVFIIVLGDDRGIKVNDTFLSQPEVLKVPVGEDFLGRVVDSLGRPIDGRTNPVVSDYLPVFRQAAGVLDREPIDEPLFTGIRTIDLVIPIGKGQRELILGDRQTGKTSIAIDSIINQKDKNVICIYCWIGGSYAAFKKILNTLIRKGALEYSIIVCSPASSSSAEQYIAPYTAATLGEYFMYKGKDVLVVFDDFTKHAWAYRQISLLLERAPGREAYPGDIFYIHSQLVERAGRLRKELGGGSMTFLPIVETLQGDITGYIQSNLVSMTDGQIYLNTGLFHEGFRPAIDLGLSVSRIGSKVQPPAIRQLGEGLRLEYAQYRELLRLTKLRTRLSEEVAFKIKRGEVLTLLFTQQNSNPSSLAEEVVLFYAFKKGILEALDLEEVEYFKNNIFNHLKENNLDLIKKIEEEKILTKEIEESLSKEIAKFFRRRKEESLKLL